MFKRKKKKQQNSTEETVEKNINDIFSQAKKSTDFSTISISVQNVSIEINFFKTLIDPSILQQSVLSAIKEKATEIQQLEDLKKIIPVEGIKIVTGHQEVSKALYNGSIIISLNNKLDELALIDISFPRLGQRELNETENEFNVIGPKVGLIEDLATNLHLLRDHLHSSDLIFEEIIIGTRTKTKAVVAYVEGITNQEYINTMKQRLNDLDLDVDYDSTQIGQMISDSTLTIFPLFIATERVDRTVGALIKGQVVLLCDKSPYALIGPATLMEFFSNPEDFYLPSIIASFFKLIRIFGMLFSIFATSFYVAILTFHYEVVPKDLLGPIIFSRANVPFPPVLEVLFLEITIDLLREAGARLPTKIGQTLGIVGGIVIGQATVEAALTSNILLIIVALSALSSFTTPIYKMSNAVRILRYPYIILASIWGGLGIFVGMIFLITHLTRLKSLGVPYLLPLYPYRRGGILHSFIRPSQTTYDERPWFLRPLSLKRFSPKTKQDPNDGLDAE